MQKTFASAYIPPPTAAAAAKRSLHRKTVTHTTAPPSYIFPQPPQKQEKRRASPPRMSPFQVSKARFVCLCVCIRQIKVGERGERGERGGDRALLWENQSILRKEKDPRPIGGRGWEKTKKCLLHDDKEMHCTLACGPGTTDQLYSKTLLNQQPPLTDYMDVMRIAIKEKGH